MFSICSLYEYPVHLLDNPRARQYLLEKERLPSPCFHQTAQLLHASHLALVELVCEVVHVESRKSGSRGRRYDGKVDATELGESLGEHSLGHVGAQSVGRVERLVDGLVRLRAARLISSEGDGALNGDTGGGDDGVGDASEVKVFEGEGLVWCKYVQGWVAFEDVVHHTSGSDLVTRFGQHASRLVDTCHAGLQDVEGCVVETHVLCDWAELRSGRNGLEVVILGDLLLALAGRGGEGQGRSSDRGENGGLHNEC